MPTVAERPRVMPAVVGALALVLSLSGCGSITTGAAGPDGSAMAEVAVEAPPPAAPDGAAPADGPPADAATEAARPADAAPDVDTRRCALKINEVQTGGAAAALDEFIELYNTCPDRATSLAGHTLVYRAEAGTTNVLLFAFAAQSFAANHPFFLCANASATYTGPSADAYYTTSGLRETGGGLALLNAAGETVDSVGWGTATNAFVEMSAAPAAAGGQSIARQPDGHDTDDNASDFTVAALPTPGAPN